MCCARVCARAPANLRACRFDREGAGRRGAARLTNIRQLHVFVAPFLFFFLKRRVCHHEFFFSFAPFGQSHFASAGTLNFKEKVEKFPTS